MPKTNSPKNIRKENKNIDKIVEEFKFKAHGSITEYQPATFCTAFLNPLKRRVEITNILKSVVRRGFTWTHHYTHTHTHTHTLHTHLYLIGDHAEKRTNYDFPPLLSGPFFPRLLQDPAGL